MFFIRGLSLASTLLLAVWGLGCQSPTPPSKASTQYNRLVQRTLAEAEARPDTSFFWLSNTGDTQARSLMLELGIDYLRYDRAADVLCLWTGEGLWPARGFATAPRAGTALTDSVGPRCEIEGSCRVQTVSDTWSRFRCE